MSSGIVWCRTMSSGNFTMQTAVPCGCSTMSYNIVRYGNSVVKSMYSITATPDDIVRYRAQCEHRLRVDCWCGRVDKSRELSSACHNARLPKKKRNSGGFFATFNMTTVVTDVKLWCPLLPYGSSYKASVICNFWHPGTLTLSPERHSECPYVKNYK